MSLPSLSSSLAQHHANIVGLFNQATQIGAVLEITTSVQPEVIPSPVDYRASAIPFFAENQGFLTFLSENHERFTTNARAIKSFPLPKNCAGVIAGSFYIEEEILKRYDSSTKTWILVVELTDTERELLPTDFPEDKIFFAFR